MRHFVLQHFLYARPGLEKNHEKEEDAVLKLGGPPVLMIW
jgi:hypothetical protein